jgi:hypothetical protein
MPAVQLSRLNQQISSLVWQFTRPTDFLPGLRDLFDLYANRVYRSGQSVPPTSLVQAYHVPTLVLRQLEIELTPSCKQHPAAALSLIDALWAEPMLESRILGATLLGYVPIEPPQPVIERIKGYTRPGIDTAILDALLEKGGRSLRLDRSDLWIELMDQWATDSLVFHQTAALRAITISIRDEQFINHPPVLGIFSGLLQTGSPSIQSELQTTLLSLLHSSPRETVFLLRQVLPLSNSPTTHRLVRLSLSKVPAEYQPGLRQALQSQTK